MHRKWHLEQYQCLEEIGWLLHLGQLDQPQQSHVHLVLHRPRKKKGSYEWNNDLVLCTVTDSLTIPWKETFGW